MAAPLAVGICFDVRDKLTVDDGLATAMLCPNNCGGKCCARLTTAMWVWMVLCGGYEIPAHDFAIHDAVRHLSNCSRRTSKKSMICARASLGKDWRCYCSPSTTIATIWRFATCSNSQARLLSVRYLNCP